MQQNCSSELYMYIYVIVLLLLLLIHKWKRMLTLQQVVVELIWTLLHTVGRVTWEFIKWSYALYVKSNLFICEYTEHVLVMQYMTFFISFREKYRCLWTITYFFIHSFSMRQAQKWAGITSPCKCLTHIL